MSDLIPMSDDHGEHDAIFDAMVLRAVQVVVDFNIEMGEEEPDAEEREFCEDLTRRVFDSIGLQVLIDAGEAMADQGGFGCIGWDRTVAPFRSRSTPLCMCGHPRGVHDEDGLCVKIVALLRVCDCEKFVPKASHD